MRHKKMTYIIIGAIVLLLIVSWVGWIVYKNQKSFNEYYFNDDGSVRTSENNQRK